MIKQTFRLVALTLMMAGCKPQAGQVFQDGPRYEVKTFRVPKGWAYSIFINKKEFVRQLYMPAIAGQEPFPSDHTARKTGLYVVSKLKNNSSPSVTQAELIRLDIIPQAQ